MILAGGIGTGQDALQDVWSLNILSSNVEGQSPNYEWTELTSEAGFGYRFGAAMWNINDHLYFGSGEFAGSVYNDVWTSPDYGVTWTLVSGAANFVARISTMTVVNGRRVVLAGGLTTSSLVPKDDVWIGFSN